MKRFCGSVMITLFFAGNLSAQHTEPDKVRKQFALLQDSLRSLRQRAINGASEPERQNANYTFIKTLTSALKLPYSYNFAFDSLKTISVQSSPDHRFRIFSWPVMYNDGSYRYYGTIQMNSPSGKLEMLPLVDYTPLIKAPEDTLTTNNAWYGAQYYKIIPVTYNVKTPYYVLLGWKGNNIKSTKKVIEVLSFKDGKASFGMPVFDGDPDRPGKKRIIFEYSRQASMALNFDAKETRIVFDHVSPPDPKLKGKYELYGPDFSYDAFRLTNGRWRFTGDIEVKNNPDQKDEIFNDPKKMTGTTPIRKL